jgi:hypothetical protein
VLERILIIPSSIRVVHSEELNLACSGSYSSVGHLDWDPGALLKERHDVPETLGRIGGTRSMDGKYFVVSSDDGLVQTPKEKG